MIGSKTVFVYGLIVLALLGCGGGGPDPRGFADIENDQNVGFSNVDFGSTTGTGSGASGGNTGGSTGVASDFAQGLFRSPGIYKNACSAPRGAPWPDRQGTRTDEKQWLRAWSHDTYLWYDEITDVDPSGPENPLAYFELLKTNATTPSGAPRDQFHFTIPTAEFIDQSQTGTSAGYGLELAFVENAPPRELIVSSVVAGSPAAASGVFRRGTRILGVDGVDLVNGNDVATLNAGLFPAAAGESHRFEISDFDGGNVQDVTLVSANVVFPPVPIVDVLNRGADRVGYLVFNDHNEPSEAALIDAVSTLAAGGVNELVLDLRYNGGGLLAIANELAYMIAGPTSEGRVFEELRFNDKYPTTDPVTGAVLVPARFEPQAVGFSVAAGTTLPTLTLTRLVVLVGAGTCSASESIINGLRGIDFPVALIGEPTCGKPYGFYPTDNCGTTYFTIQFQGANEKGFGDYADGFLPTEATPALPEEVPGCRVADDFSRELGDAEENLLETALAYLETGTCPNPPVSTLAVRPEARKGVGGAVQTTAAGGERLVDLRQRPGRVVLRQP
ncbi:MAG: S41 family peptidase [Pseudomonadota bacterium]